MKKKYIFLMCLVFMVVGYASVSTTLSLSNNTDITNILSEFDVYFSDVNINGEQNLVPVKDTTTLEFQPDFSDGDFELEYDVTNGSRNYNADVDVTCTSDLSGVQLNNEYSAGVLKANETKKGKVSIGDISMKIGDEVTIENEKFNVIAFDDTTVTLLAYNNITSGGRQSSSNNYVKFASTSGWPYAPGPLDIDIFTWSPNAKNYVNTYVSYLKGVTSDDTLTGNLITLNQLKPLGCVVSNDYTYSSTMTCANSQYASWLVPRQNYWIRSAEPTYKVHVYYASTNGRLYFDGNLSYSYGIRPVITMKKEKAVLPTITCKITATPLENKEMGNGNAPGAVEPLTESEIFCFNQGFKYGMLAPNTYNDDLEDPDHGSGSSEYYLCSNSEDFEEYNGYDEIGELVSINGTPYYDPQTFCENKGYSYGMYGANTYSSSGWEEGEYGETVYLCAYDPDFEFDVDGYDIDGNLVWQFISDEAAV